MIELLDALRALRKAVAAPVVSIGLVLSCLIVASFVGIGLAWRGAAATAYVPLQVPFLVSGGVAALGVLIFALGLFDVHLNRVHGAQRHHDTNTALRETVELLALVPELRGRGSAQPADDGSSLETVSVRVNARAAHAAPTPSTIGTRNTAE